MKGASPSGPRPARETKRINTPATGQRASHARTHAETMDQNRHDKITGHRVMKVVKAMQKANHEEQRPVSIDRLIGIIEEKTYRADIPRAELVKRYAETCQQYVPLKPGGTTARDLSRKSRKATVRNMKKYR
jgi:hypothetical protein